MLIGCLLLVLWSCMLDSMTASWKCGTLFISYNLPCWTARRIMLDQSAAMHSVCLNCVIEGKPDCKLETTGQVVVCMLLPLNQISGALTNGKSSWKSIDWTKKIHVACCIASPCFQVFHFWNNCGTSWNHLPLIDSHFFSVYWDLDCCCPFMKKIKGKCSDRWQVCFLYRFRDLYFILFLLLCVVSDFVSA